MPHTHTSTLLTLAPSGGYLTITPHPLSIGMASHQCPYHTPPFNNPREWCIGRLHDIPSCPKTASGVLVAPTPRHPGCHRRCWPAWSVLHPGHLIAPES